MSQSPPPFPYPTSPQPAPSDPYGSAADPAWASSPAPAPLEAAPSASEAPFGAAPATSASSAPSASSVSSASTAPSSSAASSTAAAASASSASGESLPVRLLKALVDFRFHRSLVADAAGILYALWILAVVLHWLGWIIIGAIIGFAPNPAAYWDSTPTAPWLPILIVLLGWIPALLAIVAGRAVIELFTATVRAARDTRESSELLARLVEQSAGDDARPSAPGDALSPTRTDGRNHA